MNTKTIWVLLAGLALSCQGLEANASDDAASVDDELAPGAALNVRLGSSRPAPTTADRTAPTDAAVIAGFAAVEIERP